MLFAIFYFTKSGLSRFIVSNMPYAFARYLKILALNVKSYATLKSLRKQESSYFYGFWTPAFAGVTGLGLL